MTSDHLFKIVDPDFQFWSIMIHVSLLPEGKNLEKNVGCFVILPWFSNNLQLISSSFNDLIVYLILLCIENTSKVNYL
jgi:hypothetical protein